MMANPLQGALNSLRTSTNLLDSSLSILDAGTSDLPRLSKVLSQTRHFELLPSSTLASAQDSLFQELEPEIQALMSRVEAYLEKLERKEKGLIAKWELQEGRLGRETELGRKGSAASGGEDKSDGPRSKALGPRDELKVKQLRSKRQRLSYAVERLQLQAQNTERNLRKSMAAQEAQQSKGPEEAPMDDEDDFKF